MVNEAVIRPERLLALSYAPLDRRAALAALLALDDALASVVRTTREPIVGAMRLTWWADALTGLDIAPPPAQPVLAALAAEALPLGIAGAALATMADGWEALLDQTPLTPDRIERHARGRGETLFVAAGAALGAGPGDPLAAAGRGWALADLARHASDPAERAAARDAARAAFAQAEERRWSRAGRALGALAIIARRGLERPGGDLRPGDVARLAWHRLTGA